MTKVIYKKLRKYWGWAYVKQDKIELYDGLKGKHHLNILIHEKLHILFPDHEEKAIRRMAKTIADMLWREGYRRIWRLQTVFVPVFRHYVQYACPQ